MRRPMMAALLTALALAACGDAVAPDMPIRGSAKFDRRAIGETMRQEKRFIVTLRPRTDAAAVARDHGVSADYVYSAVFDGFAGRMSDAARAGLLRDARVVRIDPDQVFAIEEGGTQTSPTWGLDRIDQRAASPDGSYTYVATGAGVTAYILDTGIRYSHVEFGGRARAGWDAFGGDGSDCQGHGTHVAGTVGGTKYGVAKQVDLVSVRVLNCSGAGTTATVAAGIDWVVANGARPAVINMSLGGGVDAVVNAAVARAAAAGVTVVAAAGNGGTDACTYSPASAPDALTIGATYMGDQKASYSNWGSCVDWFAPGSSIASASYSSDTGATTKSGTSMAAPHAAGAAALYLEMNPTATASDVAGALLAWTTKNVVTQAQTANAHMLYTLGEAPSSPPPPPPPAGNVAPTAHFTAECASGACTFTDASTDMDGTIAGWEWSFGDGTTSTLRSPAHTYATAGAHNVTLTVTDNAGAKDTTSQSIDVPPAEPSNLTPVASFTATCSGMSCTFRDASSDPDGTVVRWEWDFGDGASSVHQAGNDQAHTFGAGGRYAVSLTITDDDGATATHVGNVEVGPVLTVTGYRHKGRHAIDLSWSGLSGSQAAIYLGNALLATVPNKGAYSHATDNRGQLTYVFRVCEVGGTICSLNQTVTF